MTWPRKNPGTSGIRTRDLPLSRRGGGNLWYLNWHVFGFRAVSTLVGDKLFWGDHGPRKPHCGHQYNAFSGDGLLLVSASSKSQIGEGKRGWRGIEGYGSPPVHKDGLLWVHKTIWQHEKTTFLHSRTTTAMTPVSKHHFLLLYTAASNNENADSFDNQPPKSPPLESLSYTSPGKSAKEVLAVSRFSPQTWLWDQYPSQTLLKQDPRHTIVILPSFGQATAGSEVTRSLSSTTVILQCAPQVHLQRQRNTYREASDSLQPPSRDSACWCASEGEALPTFARPPTHCSIHQGHRHLSEWLRRTV